MPASRSAWATSVRDVDSALSRTSTIFNREWLMVRATSRMPEPYAPLNSRSPTHSQPKIGQVLDISFTDHLAAAYELNAAVHDGAVMLGRDSTSNQYKVSGWSYRLFPEGTPSGQVPNRGSAFNSCLAMSTVCGVDR